MVARMSPMIALPIAAIALVAAGVIYFVLVRPVQTRSATGVIIGKSFQEARDLSRTNVGARRESFTRTERRMPAGYVFDIQLDDGAVRYFLEQTAAKAYNPGDRVTVTYDQRGIPFFWSKRFVRSMARQ